MRAAMRGYRAILEKEVVELWRTYRLAITCGLFALLGIGLPVLIRYLPSITRLFGELDPELGIGRTSVADLIEALVRTLWVFGPLAGILLTMGAIAGERQARTAAFVLSKPVSHAAFVWAKFVAVALVLGLATALTIMATFLYASLLFEVQPIIPWVQVWLVAWLTSLVYVAITLAASASVRSPAGAAAVGAAALAGLTLLATVVTLNPWLPSGLEEVAKALVLGELGGDVDPFRTVAASVALIVAAISVAWLRLRTLDL